MQPIDIGHTRQLFIDVILLDSSRDVQHVLHQPQRCEPIISIDKAWEVGGVAYAVLFADDGLCRERRRHQLAQAVPRAGRVPGINGQQPGQR